MAVTSEPPRSSDVAWLTAAARGDGAAFEPFVAAHEARVYRFVQSLGLHGADADDALQETFIAAWRSAGSFAGDASAVGWLMGIARNVVRHARRRHVGEPDDFESLDVIADQAGWGSAASERDLRDEREAAVHIALATLSHDDREILVLREIEGLSGEETALALGLTLVGMKSRLHRARLRLTAALLESLAAGGLQ